MIMFQAKTSKVVSLTVLALFIMVGLSGCGAGTAVNPTQNTPATVLAIEPPVIAVGSVVATNDDDPADITVGLTICELMEVNAEKGSHLCKYPDGTTSYGFEEKSIIYSVPKQDLGLKVGDAVLAARNNSWFEKGTVKEVKSGSYVISFIESQDDETIPVGRFLPMNLVKSSYLQASR